jgi:energy-converting hydrogenase Eha subunit C
VPFNISIYRIDLELLRSIQSLAKVSMLQRRIWVSGGLEVCLVTNNLEMLQMLALIYSLICFLTACQRYLHLFGHTLLMIFPHFVLVLTATSALHIVLFPHFQVDQFCLVPVPYKDVQVNLKILLNLSSICFFCKDYIMIFCNFIKALILSGPFLRAAGYKHFSSPLF